MAVPLAVLIVLALVGLAQTSLGSSVLDDAGLGVEPETFTELQFSAPEHLPSEWTAKPRRIDLPFQIRNVSKRSRGYDWTLVVAGAQRKVLDEGHLTLGAQERQSVQAHGSLACEGARTRVEVQISTTPVQSIGLWLKCPDGPSPADRRKAREQARAKAKAKAAKAKARAKAKAKARAKRKAKQQAPVRTPVPDVTAAPTPRPSTPPPAPKPKPKPKPKPTPAQTIFPSPSDPEPERTVFPPG